jgi:putative phosphoribosyl transferase
MFVDRREAGTQLAALLGGRLWPRPPVVLGLPRGGVPVALEIACALHAPLDIMTVRKIGMPGQPEFAIGAVASGDITVRDPSGIAMPESEFERLADRERAELRRREQAYRPSAGRLDLAGKSAVLVDDGVATGATMLAALRAARQAGGAEVVVVAPVASVEAAARLEREANAVIVLHRPLFLMSISEWYEDFEQLGDDEVRRLLESAQARSGAAP